MKLKNLLLAALVVLALVIPISAASAQDDMKIQCDSTLATLLLVAEHDYDYLSHMMMDEAMMESPALRIDLGHLQPVAESIMAMMMAMEEGDMSDMSEEDMMMHDEMLAEMMAMSPADQVAAYLAGMNMEMMDMMALPAGAVAGEDPACAAVRTEVESFILAHILTEMAMMEGM